MNTFTEKGFTYDFCNWFESLMSKKSLVLISNRSFTELQESPVYPVFFKSRLQELTNIDFPVGNYRSKLKTGAEKTLEEIKKMKLEEFE